MKNEFNITQLKKSTQEELSLDENTPWLKSLLEEFCNGLTPDDYEQGEELPSISFQGIVKLCDDSKFHDYVVFEGSFVMNFYTLCIKTGTVILDSLNASVEAAFINSSLKDKLELKEEVDIFITDKEYELYFHEKGKFDIRPVLVEYAHVNKNPYPTLETWP
ncbi:MAG: hypothetical protein HN576_14135 [Bacteriovoracaceae bacterium]|jgi:uncharacterized protein|nr:hypothetical protein [Bacteriovoracaceae bacterium]